MKSRVRSYCQAIGRIKQGETIESAQAEMKAIAARLATSHPKDNQGRVELMSYPTLGRLNFGFNRENNPYDGATIFRWRKPYRTENRQRLSGSTPHARDRRRRSKARRAEPTDQAESEHSEIFA